MRHLDLFSGIGGFALAAQNVWGAKHEIVAFCEIEEYAQVVLKKHWPNVPIIDDIRKVYEKKYQSIDIISGGFPCQDLSSNGKQAGIEGSRSGLWEELNKVIGSIRPRFALLENVTNLLAGEWGDWFGKVLSDLATSRYDAQWYCIPASAIGCCHRRDRVFILAYPSSIRWDAAWFHNAITQKYQAMARQYSSPSNQEVRRLSKADVCRKNDGIPYWMERLKGLGNAIVPQIAEIFFLTIKELEKGQKVLF